MTPEAKLAYVLRRMADALDFELLRVTEDSEVEMPNAEELRGLDWGVEVIDEFRYHRLHSRVQRFLEAPGIGDL